MIEFPEAVFPNPSNKVALAAEVGYAHYDICRRTSWNKFWIKILYSAHYFSDFLLINKVKGPFLQAKFLGVGFIHMRQNINKGITYAYCIVIFHNIEYFLPI